jgi:sugar O-acyltransferase (sialic acid O-acetyltransferase NeuD family)
LEWLGIGMRAPRDLVLVGGGGHASDVLQAIEVINALAPTWHVVGILDDAQIDPRRFVCRGVEQIGTIDEIGGVNACFVLCLGWPWTRLAVADRIGSTAEAAPAIVHPRADVGVGVELGQGSVVLGNAHISPMARFGAHALISYLASVGHDCEFGRFGSVMPGAAVSGDVVAGEGVLVGTGAVVREGVKIGDCVRVGAGAVVVDDVRSGRTVVGVPARSRG